MADQAPLIFTPRLGGLFPASPAAQKAMADVKSPVRIKITRMQGNHKRIALYWITLGIAAPILSGLCEGDAIDDTMLHRILKDRRGLYGQTTLPSGEVVKNYDSISFATMSEPERNDFIQWSFETLSKWLGVEVQTLTAEAQQAA